MCRENQQRMAGATLIDVSHWLGVSFFSLIRVARHEAIQSNMLWSLSCLKPQALNQDLCRSPPKPGRFG